MAKKSQKNSKGRGKGNFQNGKGGQSKSGSNPRFHMSSERSGIASQIAGTLTKTAEDAIAANKRRAGNVQQNVSVGNQFYFPFANDKVAQAPEYGTPGIMTIYYTPTFGYNENANSRIQKTADTLHQDIYAYLTTNVSFNPCDLILYIVGLSELFAWTATLSRLVNVLGYKTWTSDYDRRGFVRALGFDYDDMVRHQTDLVSHIDDIRTDLSGFALPPNAEYSARHEWLNSEIFTDEDNDGGQMYAFVQRTYLKLTTHTEESGLETYRLVEIDNPGDTSADVIYNGKGLVTGHQDIRANTATQLGYVENHAHPTFLTFNDILNITSQMLDPFIANKDMKDIRGYIAKAYAGNMRTIPIFEHSDTWTPKYNPGALLQIENMTLVGHLDTDSTMLTEDYTGKILLSQPKVTGLYAAREGNTRYCLDDWSDCYGVELPKSKILNVHVPEITPEYALWGTKLMNTVTYKNDAWHVFTARTEIAEFALIWVTDYNYNAASQPDQFYQYTVPIYYYNKAMTTSDLAINVNETWSNLYSGLTSLVNPRIQLYRWLAQFKQKPTTLDGLVCVNHDGNNPNYVNNYASFAPNVCLDEFSLITTEQLLKLANTDLSDQFYPKYK